MKCYSIFNHSCPSCAGSFMVHEIKYFALPKTTKCLYRRNLTQIGIKRIERKQMTVMFHLTDSVVPEVDFCERSNWKL